MLDGTIPQEEYPRYLQIVFDETNRMKRLIADLLQLSRMDKGVDKLTWSDFDLNELIRRVLIGRMNDIEEKSLNVQIDFCTEPCLYMPTATVFRRSCTTLWIMPSSSSLRKGT